MEKNLSYVIQQGNTAAAEEIQLREMRAGFMALVWMVLGWGHAYLWFTTELTWSTVLTMWFLTLIPAWWIGRKLASISFWIDKKLFW